jgi:hypothetical protein
LLSRAPQFKSAFGLWDMAATLCNKKATCQVGSRCKQAIMSWPRIIRTEEVQKLREISFKSVGIRKSIPRSRLTAIVASRFSNKSGMVRW